MSSNKIKNSYLLFITNKSFININHNFKIINSYPVTTSHRINIPPTEHTKHSDSPRNAKIIRHHYFLLYFHSNTRNKMLKSFFILPLSSLGSTFFLNFQFHLSQILCFPLLPADVKQPPRCRWFSLWS